MSPNEILSASWLVFAVSLNLTVCYINAFSVCCNAEMVMLEDVAQFAMGLFFQMFRKSTHSQPKRNNFLTCAHTKTALLLPLVQASLRLLLY